MRRFNKSKMIFLLSLLLLIPSTVLNASPKDLLLNLNFRNEAISTVLTEIGRQTSLSVVYNVKDVDPNYAVSITANDENLNSVMEKVLNNTKVSYSVHDKYLVLYTSSTPEATLKMQQSKRAITGNVTDNYGDPLIGVSVIVVGTSTGAITDMDGNFSIEVPNDKAVLEFSYIGYKKQQIKVGLSNSLKVVMQEDAQLINEVVVTAMGIERKEKSLTYATQKVTGDDLMKVQDANFVNSLQGRVAGMSITQSAGGAGGKTTITLRGSKSILGNNSPLIIIDGIPMSNGGTSKEDASNITYSSRSEGSDPLSSINPDDIESINVLKGANAAALYGSVAANGAIMITTKKGKEGRIDINVSSNVTFEKPLLTPKIQNIYGANVNLDANTLDLDSWGKKLSDMTSAELAYEGAKLRNTGNDDVSDFFKTGATYNNSVSLSGGNELIRSYFSYANSYTKGMVPNNTYNRNNFSFRQSYSLLKKKLNIDVSINYINAQTKNRTGGGTVLNPLYDLYTTPRNIDTRYYKNNYMTEGTWMSNSQNIYVKDEKTGSFQLVPSQIELKGIQQMWAYQTPGRNNPYWLVNNNNSKRDEERVFGSAQVKYEIIDGLKAQVRFSGDRTRFKNSTKRFATTWNPSAMEDYGIYGLDHIRTNEFYLDYLLSFNREIKDFSLQATAGWVEHTIKTDGQSLWTKATTFDPNRQKMSTWVNNFDPSASGGSPGERRHWVDSNWDRAALFTAQVGYKDMIFVDGSYRRDWYRPFKQFSKFGTPDNYGYFGLGANALISNMVKLPEVITNLKVRSSYSEVGNSIPNILFATTTSNNITGGVVSSNYTSFENCRPEITKSFEAGFDMSLFRNALEIEATYYHAVSKDAYLAFGNTAGLTVPLNTGKIRNQGVEGTVSYSLNIARGLLWRTSANISYNDNKILKTSRDSNGNERLVDQKIAGGKIQVKFVEGGSYGDMYATDFARDKDGNIKLTSDGAPNLSNKPREKYGLYIGNMNAKYQLGWSNTFTYKGFTLYFLINGKIGGKVVSFTEAELDKLGVSQRSADARIAAENNPDLVWNGRPALVMPDGNLAPIDSYYKTIGGDVNASQYVYDGTNFRLRELSLGYTFQNLFGPSKNLSLSFVGRNLFFIYKKAPVDPDVSLSTQNALGAFEIFNMPSARSFGLSLKANF